MLRMKWNEFLTAISYNLPLPLSCQWSWASRCVGRVKSKHDRDLVFTNHEINASTASNEFNVYRCGNCAPNTTVSTCIYENEAFSLFEENEFMIQIDITTITTMGHRDWSLRLPLWYKVKHIFILHPVLLLNRQYVSHVRVTLNLRKSFLRNESLNSLVFLRLRWWLISFIHIDWQRSTCQTNNNINTRANPTTSWWINQQEKERKMKTKLCDQFRRSAVVQWNGMENQFCLIKCSRAHDSHGCVYFAVCRNRQHFQLPSTLRILQ